jgi:benzoyl-CoA reductase subunit C
VEALETFRNLLSTRHAIARRWKSQNKRVIGWSCTYTPEEIIYAAEALPVMIFGDLASTTLADALLPRNVCSFARSSFDVGLRGTYDYLDGYVVSNCCDNCSKMYDLWRYHVKIPYFHLLNTPHTNTEKAHSFFHEELQRFRKSLDNTLKTQISDESLRSAIRIYNENRVLLKKAYDLRRKNPPLISGVEALEMVLSSLATPKTEHNELLNQLFNEVASCLNPPKEGVRLLVSGSEIDNTELIRIVEDLGGNVVADDLSTGSRYFWNLVGPDSDPLRAISRRYLDMIPSPFMYDHEERFNHVNEMVRRYDVEGVIIFVLKFCDAHLFDAPLLVEELKELGLPVLDLEWEYSMGGIAQLRTRVEAFIEMVGGVK